MLGIGGKFASSKGMVAVPNLSSLSSSQAQALIQASGLVVGSIGSSSTSNSSLDGRVQAQTVAAGTLVEYETVVGINVYSYVAPPPPVDPGPSAPYIVSSTGCVYTKTVNYRIVCVNTSGSGYATWEDQAYGIYTWSDGSTTEYNCGSPTGGNEGNILNTYTECGYSPPVTSCTGSYPGTKVTGSCSGGKKCTATPYYDSCGNYLKTTTSCVACCTAGSLVGCKTTYTSLNKYYTVCTYRNSDCSTYTKTTYGCNEYCTTSCGKCVYIGGGLSYKSCTKTCECSGTSTSSVKC